MSIRAYKIKEIVLEKNPTFHVGKNFDWLEPMASSSTFNHDGECKELEFNVDDLIAVKGLLKNEPEKLKILNAILKDMGDEEYVAYSCY